MFKGDSQEAAPLDINAIILEVLALVDSQVQKQQVLLRIDLAESLPQASGNRTQLQQVILNLVRNAIEAMSSINNRQRALRVQSEFREPSSVLVTIEDSGTGIDPKNIERIFDPLFTTKPQGMGMGLSICRSIIEAHHGRLWASPNVGHGSTFHLILPSASSGQNEGL
jgi:signal transduction histidine kinase